MISLKDFFSFKNNKVFWVNLIAMPIVVVSVIFGVLHWLDTYTHHGESIIVPNINGKPLMPSTLNPNIPGGLEQIIMKAMEQEPNQRYSSAQELLYDMDEFRKDPTILFDYHNDNII